MSSRFGGKLLQIRGPAEEKPCLPNWVWLKTKTTITTSSSIITGYILGELRLSGIQLIPPAAPFPEENVWVQMAEVFMALCVVKPTGLRH